MEIEPHQWKPIVDGMATFAITFAQMGDAEEDARAKLIGYLQGQLHVEQVDAVRILRAAAEVIRSFPQPPDESAERLERGRAVRELLGVPEPADDIAATLRAREWLERLATDLDSGLPSPGGGA